jgi:hypothetical protein
MDSGEQWTCTTCTLLNNVLAQVCEACGSTSPLVLDAFKQEAECERAASNKYSPHANPFRNSNESIDEDFKAAESLDPWRQAESEWAEVEAKQVMNMKTSKQTKINRK